MSHCSFRTRTTLATISLASVVATVGCSESEESGIPQNAVVIGLLLPYTGGDAAMGTHYEQAAAIARDMVNEAGGIDGRPLHFVARDTHSDPVRAAESLRDLLKYNVKAVIGPEGAEVASALLPTMQEEKVLFISPVVSGASTLSATGEHPWFRLAPSSYSLGHAFANHLVFKRNVTRIATVHSPDDYNMDFIAALEERFVALGGVVEASLSLPTQQRGYVNEVRQLRLGKTRDVVLAASIDSAARLVIELTVAERENAWSWYLSPGLQSPAFLANTRVSALEGSVGVGLRVANPDAEYVSMYRERWSETPLDGAYFYTDAINALSLAVHQASHNSQGEISYETLAAAMSSVTTPTGLQVRWRQQAEGFRYIEDSRRVYYSGLTGPLLFTSDGQQRTVTMATWSIANGSIVATE